MSTPDHPTCREVFGNQEKDAGWLSKPSRALGGISALEANTTPQGYAAAVKLLELLRHGFAS
ncbi:MbcA/ParS/Xre antitoxin family protein [Halomonas chromatireducens]|uniref:MbcA/ParS/Xre antitoxin family protein n=1 Tax=Halomonas chromatireducens TaxID=507626 RepID=UPI003AAFB32D